MNTQQRTSPRTQMPTLPAGVIALRDERGRPTGQLVELNSGKIYDRSGTVTGMLGQPDPDRDLIVTEMFAREYYSQWLPKLGKTSCELTDRGGRLVTMDLAPTDVHIDHLLPNYAAGYRLADGAADIAAPVIVTEHNSNKFATWDPQNAFKRVKPNGGAPGAQPSEVNPTLSFSQYSCLEYSLGTFVTVEVQANADVPLQPLQAGVRRLMSAFKLEREIRVSSMLRTVGNWTSNLVQALVASTKWNGGVSSDPVANIHAAIDASPMSIDRIVWAGQTYRAFVRNPAVQKYIAFKSSAAPIPTASQISALLELPPISTVEMKYNVPSNGATPYPFVWGGDVVLLHEPATLPPTSQDDVANAVTFRWNGANSAVRDGEYSAGFLVRTYWDPKRGSRGGMVMVVVVNDAELMTSNLIGGLITGAVA